MLDILEAIDEVDVMLDGFDLARLGSDRIRRAAHERFLEIISEASRHIPAEFKSNASHIPWRKVADIGNHLRHGYNRIDLAILWSLYEDGLLVQLRESIGEAVAIKPRTP